MHPLRSGWSSAPTSGSVIEGLDLLKICPWDQSRNRTRKIKNSLVEENVLKLEYLEEFGARFNTRITAICWHPKFPYTYAVASKHGDVIVGSVDRKLDGVRGSDEDLHWKLRQTAAIEGSGPGGSITAMQFDKHERNILYRTSIDSTVARVDLQHSANSYQYWDFDSYERWFTAMDINYTSRVLVAGDNRGDVKLFNLSDGKDMGTHRFHKAKIHHIEFSKRDPNILVTAGLPSGDPVKIWDVRMLYNKTPLMTLEHNSGVNVAKFNPTDGTQLLTSDQDNEIRIYPFRGSFFGKPKIIKHRHKQFQHITAIKADWHPLTDLIVIGKYPKASPETRIRKSIEFYNPESGNCVGEILQPQDKIASLNVFNPTGELLASGMSSELVIWRPFSEDKDEFGSQDVPPPQHSSQTLTLSQEVRSQLRGRNTATRSAAATTTRGRGRRAREYSPVSDADNDENGRDKKRPKKVPSKTKTVKKK